MITMRKHRWSGIRGGLLATMMLAALWGAPASDAQNAGPCYVEQGCRCGYHIEDDYAYYGNCETTTGAYIQWTYRTENGSIQPGIACVPRNTVWGPLVPSEDIVDFWGMTGFC